MSDQEAKSGPLRFTKQEKISASGDTTGQYSVLLPDGRTQVREYFFLELKIFFLFFFQTVRYSVTGDGGFVADVTYSRGGRSFNL